jgi:catechol 2,3-dioxygenase-like lactoylglutathione lyase family enzyme
MLHGRRGGAAMTHEGFRVEQIDHVEVFVPDQYAAAAWYRRVLGLEILAEYEDWAPDGGPLMISSDGGRTMLALFAGEPQGRHAVVGLRRVAFRVDAADFLQFLDRLERVPVYDAISAPVGRADVVDHDRAFSIYFCDPYGNPYEVTTYEYAPVAQRLAACRREGHQRAAAGAGETRGMVTMRIEHPSPEARGGHPEVEDASGVRINGGREPIRRVSCSF